MPEVGKGTVSISPDFTGFGREVDRGITPHIDKAGKEMEATFASSSKKSAASVTAAFDHVAAKAKTEFKGIPVTADAAKLDASVVSAAKRAAAKAADELSRIPGGVDAITFEAKVSAAASKAANEAATRLANIPVGIDSSKLQAEVAAAAAKAATPVHVTADTSGFSRLPGDIRPHVQKAGDEIESTFSASAGKAARTLTGILGAKLTIDVGRRLLQLGTQVEVFGKKAEVVFEDSADEVRAWAKENAASLGLTQNHLTGVAAGFADLLKPMGFTAAAAAEMSTKTVGLAGALAAWSEAQDTAADVTQTLAKAMLGEREELKGLGISITEADVKARLLANGQDKLTGAALQQAEAIATQELIFEKSTDAQTAWANGSQDAVIKQNELRAKVDELVEQMATGFLPVFQGAATVLEALPDPAIKAAAGLIAIGAAAVGVNKLVQAVKGLPNPLERTSLASAGAQKGLAGFATTTLGLTAAAVAVHELDEAINDWRAAPPPNLTELTNSLVRFQREGKVSGELARQFGSDLGGLGTKIRDIDKLGGVNIAKGFAVGKSAIEDLNALSESLAELVRTGEKDLASTVLEQIATEAGISVPKVIKHLGSYSDSLTALDTDQRLAGKSAGALGDATGDMADVVARAEEEVERYAQTLKDAYGASQSLIGSSLSAADAVNALRDSAAETAGKELELAAAIRTHGASSNEAKAAGEALQDARRRQVGDIDSLAQANVRLAEVQANAAGRTISDADKYRIYRDELIKVKDTLAPGSDLRKNLEGLINSLPPPEVKAKVVLEVTEATAAIARLQAQFTGWAKATPLGRTIPTAHGGGMILGSAAEVPILAKPGEFVLQESAATAIGPANLAALNRFHTGGMVGGAQVLDRIARVAEPVQGSTGGDTRFDVGGITINGVPDGETAAFLLPMRLRSEMFLVGG